MTTGLSRLKKAQQAILLAEVGALLHNLGKVSHQFFESQSGSGSSAYRYQHILRFILDDYPALETDLTKLAEDLDEPENQDVVKTETIRLLKTLFSLPAPFDDRTYRIGDLIEYLGQGTLVEIPEQRKLRLYGQGDRWIEHIFPSGARLLHLLNRAHDAASGGDKQDIWSLGQDNDTLFRATPMGWEKPALTLDEVDELRGKVENLLARFLDPPSVPFSLQDFADALREHFASALADTRRPLNDISVWDMGQTGAAFLKTGVVTYVLLDKSLSHDDLSARENNNKLFWRVLSCRLNGLEYLEKALSLAEIRARYRLLNEKLNHLRNTLETLPLATEIYRDENGGFYLFPDITENSVLFEEIRQLLEPLLPIDGVAFSLQLSGRLAGHLRDQTPTVPYVGHYIQKQSGVRPMSQHYLPDYDAWKTVTSDICTACGVRPQGYGAAQITDYAHNPSYYQAKASSRNVCCICMDRHRGISQAWCNNLSGTTVWIDEATDRNGRLALLVGRFYLDEFLTSIQYPSQKSERSELQIHFLKDEPDDGTRVFLRDKERPFIWDAKRKQLLGLSGAQSVSKFKDPKLKIHAPIHYQTTLTDVTRVDGNYHMVLTDELPSTLGLGSHCRIWGQEFLVVDQRTLSPNTPSAVDKLLSIALWGAPAWPFYVKKSTQVTKITEGVLSQSFARISRVWETTRHFWQKALDLQDDKDRPSIPKSGSRLLIQGEPLPNEPDDSLGLFHVYELVIGQTKLSVVWDPDHSYFISADNLEYISSLLEKDLSKALMNESLTIEEPAGYGSKNKVWGQLADVQVASLVDEDGLPLQYTPAIPILAEPRTFMALVPADRALSVARAISREYRHQMGKVQSRLPLSLGVVYAPRRTPLRALIDAGRQMLDVPTQSMPWTLSQNAQMKDGKIELTFDNEQIWQVSTLTGDKETDDLWYPYFLVDVDKDDNLMNYRALAFRDKRLVSENQGSVGWFVHARELRRGDRVIVYPSTFDFEFLDTTARRFELHYDPDTGRRTSRPTRPYLLDDLQRLDHLWDRFGQLTRAQINQVIGAIEETRLAWDAGLIKRRDDDPVFWDFCADTLAGANWPKEDKKGCDLRWRKWTEDQRKELTAAAAAGELADLVELHLQILKEKREE